ncbi:hypothetical protein V3C99_010395 [Haemonchus contortus]|uniref:ATP-dependent DNA helicase n=1 Tax=Haemonchus contortus TaxID=6289 RepID=A0A7I4YGH0_HAECO
MDLEGLYREGHSFFMVIVGDFKAKIGPKRTSKELHIGTHGMELNEQSGRLSELIMSAQVAVVPKFTRDRTIVSSALQVNGKIPSPTILTKNTTGSSSVSAIVLWKRESTYSQETALFENLLSDGQC